MTHNELILKHLLDLNIHGLFDKHASLNELNKAVEHVIQGRRYISQIFHQHWRRANVVSPGRRC